MSNKTQLSFGASGDVNILNNNVTVEKLFRNKMKHREVENINYIKDKIKPYPDFLLDYQIENNNQRDYKKKLIMPYLREDKGWILGTIYDYDIYKKFRIALIKLHKIGFYHNDIKRENIFINNKTKEIKLIDFDNSLNNDIIDEVYNTNDNKKIRGLNVSFINTFPAYCNELIEESNKLEGNNNYIEKERFKEILQLNDLYCLDTLYYGKPYKEMFENEMKKKDNRIHPTPLNIDSKNIKKKITSSYYNEYIEKLLKEKKLIYCLEGKDLKQEDKKRVREINEILKRLHYNISKKNNNFNY